MIPNNRMLGGDKRMVGEVGGGRGDGRLHDDGLLWAAVTGLL